MNSIRAVSTALPKIRADNSMIEQAAARWLAGAADEYQLFKRFLSSSHTDFRHFIIHPDEVVVLQSQQLKAELFEQHAPALAIQALSAALEESGIEAQSIDALILTSCSCPLIPALDTYVIEALGLRRDIVRVPAYQFGCAGGVIGLGLASKLMDEIQNTAVVSAECCSLVFQPTNRSASHLVGAAIFGDGAAAAVLSRTSSGGLRILSHRSHLLPGTRHLMGYDIMDTGAHLRLDKSLPGHLVHAVPELVDSFLAQHGLSREEVAWWLFHPGSSKILSFLGEVLQLEEQQMSWSAATLKNFGNLSSASILFVLESFKRSKVARPGDRIMILGVGPGLTIEMMLLQNSTIIS